MTNLHLEENCPNFRELSCFVARDKFAALVKGYFMTTIAIDVGDKRVGVAIFAADTGIVLPHGTYNRAKGEAERAILELLETKNAHTLVVGMPYNSDGSENMQCHKVRVFAKRISRRSEVTIKFHNEYGSSADARQKLAQRHTKGSMPKEKGIVDALAASAILQDYLILV